MKLPSCGRAKVKLGKVSPTAGGGMSGYRQRRHGCPPGGMKRACPDHAVTAQAYIDIYQEMLHRPLVDEVFENAN